MSNMFNQASLFNQDISEWDVSNVINMNYMFGHATTFDGLIGNWNVSSVTDMSNMFNLASSFNQDISKWDVSNVTNMASMFMHTKSFNQSIGDWDVSNVTNMDYMFAKTVLFNQNLGNWSISTLTSTTGIFEEAESFRQQFGSKKVSDTNNEYSAPPPDYSVSSPVNTLPTKWYEIMALNPLSDLGNGWRYSDWFKTFYIDVNSHWAYHIDHHWIYISSNDTSSLYFYKNGNWLWTDPLIYPFAYNYDTNSWIYFQSSGGDFRYYDYGKEDWFK